MPKDTRNVKEDLPAVCLPSWLEETGSLIVFSNLLSHIYV
jgi:hypothetical protein